MKTNGNALFLILIAVALFAALSYAVTQSGRGGGSADREQVELQVAQIAQHISVIQQYANRRDALGQFDHYTLSTDAENAAGNVPQLDGTNITGRTIGIYNSAIGEPVMQPPADLHDPIQPIAGFTYWWMHNIRMQRADGVDLGTAAPDEVIFVTWVNDEACRVLQYVASIEAAMNKMTLLNGTADTEFSFDTTEWGFSDYQHSTPQPDQNKVFHPDGGGATWQSFSDLTTFWKFVGENAVTGLGECADNSSSACKELMFMLTDISDALCIEVNRNTIGIDTIPVDDAHSGSLSQSGSAFDGVYGNMLVADYEIGNAPEVVGQPIGCIRDGSRNVFYAVLLAR